MNGFLEKSLKIKSALKSAGESLRNHEKYLNLFSKIHSSVNGEQDQYKIFVPLFGVADAAPNKGTIILCYQIKAQ